MAPVVSKALFFFLGICALLPWNAFITASNFFHSRLVGTTYENTFESFIGLVFTSFNLFAIVLFIPGVQALFAESTLVVVPFFLKGTVFLTMTILTVAGLTLSAEALFGVTLFLVIVAGIMSTPSIAGVLSLASKAPPETGDLISPFFMGEALSGVLMSVVSLVTTVASQTAPSCSALSDNSTRVDDGNQQDWGAFSYFLVAALACYSCILLYHIARRGLGTVSSEGFDDGDGDDDGEKKKSGIDATAPQERDSREHIADTRTAVRKASQPELPENETWELNAVWKIAKVVFYPCLTLILTFGVTLSLFPAITAATVSTSYCKPGSSAFHNQLFVPVLFLLFNMGDFGGRVIHLYKQPFSPPQLVALALLRLGFVPFFLLMNLRGSRLDPVFTADAWPICITFLFGLSNGFVATAGFVAAPFLVPSQHRRVVSLLTVLCQELGCVIGICLSFGVVSAVF